MNALTTTLTDSQIPNDHAFATLLKESGWKGDYTQIGNSNTFRRPDSSPIAVVFYDNTKPRIVKVGLFV